MISLLMQLSRVRFWSYATVGVLTFGFDLLLMYSLITFAQVPVVIATALAFFVAVSINYHVSRRFVFVGTRQSVWRGHLYFVALALAGATVTATFVWLLAPHETGLDLYLNRMLIAALVGTVNYFLNLYYNFQMV